MNIGIIGAGHIGSTLAGLLTRVGHQVKIANSRGPETIAAVASEAGAIAVSVREAVRGVAVVIVTIPMKNVVDLPRDLFDDVPADVVVADTCNYYPRLRDGPIAAIEQGEAETRWVSEQLGRPLVKAFNNINFAHLAVAGRPAGTPGRVALPVAGDDPHAKAVIFALVDEIGFEPVDAGGIDESWRQQPGTPVYGSDLDAEGVKRALKAADREKAAAARS